MPKVLMAKNNRSKVVQTAIESRCKELGITQSDLVNETGISMTALYHIKKKGEVTSQQFRLLNTVLQFPEKVSTELVRVLFGIESEKSNMEKKLDLLIEICRGRNESKRYQYEDKAGN